MNKLIGSNIVAITLATTIVAALALGGCNKPMQPIANLANLANVSDIDVTQNVKTALHQSDTLKSFNITVITQKGDVRLIGILDNQVQIDEAIKIARAAEGVHTIHDELMIKM